MSQKQEIDTLKKLATSDLLVDLRSRPGKPFRELLVSDIGMAVTRDIARNFGGNGTRALRSSIQTVSSALGIRDLRKWDSRERIALERWCPMLALIPGLDGWSRRDKRALIEVIRAKAARNEKSFVGLMQKHKRFREALLNISEFE